MSQSAELFGVAGGHLDAQHARLVGALFDEVQLGRAFLDGQLVGCLEADHFGKLATVLRGRNGEVANQHVLAADGYSSVCGFEAGFAEPEADHFPKFGRTGGGQRRLDVAVKDAMDADRARCGGSLDRAQASGPPFDRYDIPGARRHEKTTSCHSRARPCIARIGVTTRRSSTTAPPSRLFRGGNH